MRSTGSDSAQEVQKQTPVINKTEYYVIEVASISYLAL